MDNYNQSQQFTKYTVLDSQPITAGAVSKKFMANVFGWMFLALGVSAIMAIVFATNADLAQSLYTVSETGRHGLTGLGMLVTFAPLGFVFAMRLGYARFSSSVIAALFVAFAVLMGMSLSCVILTYTTGSLIGCFAASAGMFGIMAIMGYTTD